MQTAITLGAQALIAVVVAVLSVRLALARYYKEKWWEKKYEAYSAIIDALHHMKRYPDRMLDDHEPDAKERAELEEHYAKAKAELRKRIDIGHLVISPDAVAALAKLIKDQATAAESKDFITVVEADFVATKGCLERIREIARADLKVPS